MRIRNFIFGLIGVAALAGFATTANAGGFGFSFSYNHGHYYRPVVVERAYDYDRCYADDYYVAPACDTVYVAPRVVYSDYYRPVVYRDYYRPAYRSTYVSYRSYRPSYARSYYSPRYHGHRSYGGSFYYRH